MSKNTEEVTKYLPHRNPFLFIDEIVSVEVGKKIHCIKNNSPDEDYFKGHFPNNPVMPGVIILEALAQASGILGFKTMNKTPEEGSIYVFAGVDKVRFRKRVGPEDVIHLYSEVINEKKVFGNLKLVQRSMEILFVLQPFYVQIGKRRWL
jgi:3-hydroxyacyl-[acyl-carrier-protein] dehydratase